MEDKIQETDDTRDSLEARFLEPIRSTLEKELKRIMVRFDPIDSKIEAVEDRTKRLENLWGKYVEGFVSTRETVDKWKDEMWAAINDNKKHSETSLKELRKMSESALNEAKRYHFWWRVTSAILLVLLGGAVVSFSFLIIRGGL